MDLETLNSELHRTQLELQHSQAVIQAMESSKFWKLRTRWLNAKTLVRRYPGMALKPTLRLATRLLTNAKDKWRSYVEPAPLTPAPVVVPPEITPSEFWKKIDPVIQEQVNCFEASTPKISILTPTFNSSLSWFVDTVLSVLHQSSTEWEWCIVDDGSTVSEIRSVLETLAQKHPRIKVLLQPSGGISAATNKALELASGDYVCFLDHDDTLTPDAIQASLKKLSQGFDLVYSDEDKIDSSGLHYIEPFFKPDWSPEYFRGVMYVGHFLSIRRELVVAAGGFDRQYDGVQDYELVLRLSEITQNIGHIPKILYHWRKIEGSVASDPQAKPAVEVLQQAAVRSHLERLGLPATAKSLGNHRLGLISAPRTEHPLISIIIPTKNAPDHLERCLNSLFTLSNYPNFEVVLVDNETDDPRALQTMRQHPIKRLNFPGTFNYSRANNLGATYANGEYLVFLNNDTEVLTEDWLQQLLYYAEQPDVGAVGALLLFPDRTVQHAGVVMGSRGTADHIMRGFPSDVDGYAGSLVCAREVSAVTAACMMVRKHDFQAVNHFNEHFFTHYQDVDLCMKLVNLGKRIIFTPRAVLIHHESVTRRNYYDLVDRYLLLDQWQHYIEAGDPFYNLNFDVARCDYGVKVY
ncbi:glycosyltransferase family 2 protein [Phormidium sp. FACHB-592]|uniref:Glycosyltransferase family 2 protein n=1 Tax=Stenomitos frigidus AS-A4 TaxID=2933935 RepID=A0ABV0KGD5_9CYAN|nr:MULTISPECIES: glycosyltransferase family 2 protein [Cyanophyceae]MBD2035775.1 glycosyltransferase family 2 protein [Leptolyngbya sp. FACHB-321]MBD2078126.1 glycosyltransferase family 2 protein [Phormidium sp. FACHB-592]